MRKLKDRNKRDDVSQRSSGWANMLPASISLGYSYGFPIDFKKDMNKNLVNKLWESHPLWAACPLEKQTSSDTCDVVSENESFKWDDATKECKCTPARKVSCSASSTRAQVQVVEPAAQLSDAGTKAVSTLLNAVIQYSANGSAVVPFCLGSDKYCHKDPVRSIYGTVTLKNDAFCSGYEVSANVKELTFGSACFLATAESRMR